MFKKVSKPSNLRQSSGAALPSNSFNSTIQNDVENDDANGIKHDDKHIGGARYEHNGDDADKHGALADSDKWSNSTNRANQRQNRHDDDGDDSDDDDDDDEDSDDDDGVVITRIDRKRAGKPVMASSSLDKAHLQQQSSHQGNSHLQDVKIYEASRSIEREGVRDMGATATTEIDPEEMQSAGSILTGIKSGAESKTAKFGPSRLPANLRTTVIFDYKPDICKDYKETGFCNRGDTCIFLHDRGEAKQGLIEHDWKTGITKRKKINSDSQSTKESSEDDLPFACFICRKPFVNPVVTRCKHYFCEKCAFDEYRKSSKCFVCAQPTNGIFNVAKDILEKLKKRKDAKQIADEDELS